MACLGIWLAGLLGKLFDEGPDPPIIFIDNNSAIQLSMNPVFDDRSKHIETRYHLMGDDMCRSQRPPRLAFLLEVYRYWAAQ